jgi:hypothetical protein
LKVKWLIKVSGKIISDKVGASNYGKMVHFMKGIGCRIQCMDTDDTLQLMAIFMKESGLKVTQTATVRIN